MYSLQIATLSIEVTAVMIAIFMALGAELSRK